MEELEIKEETKEEIKKKDRLMIFTFGSLALSLVSTIFYMLYAIATSGSLVDQIISIIGVVILVAFSICLVFAGFFIENKKAKIFISVASLILAFYSIFQVITDINKPKDFVLNFVDKDIKEVTSWAKKRDIEVIQTFEYSDKYEEFHIIKQDVKEGTSVKKIKKIKVTVSNGSDPLKTADVTNMVGWKLDDVIKFVEDNHLTNVTIKFEFSTTVDKDKIISQDLIREIKRNEPITLVSSLGRESSQTSVTLDNLVGMDIFHATTYLGRNNIKYSLVYSYSEDKDGIVLKQTPNKWTVIGPNRADEVVLTVAKQNQVTIPDIKNMNKNEITEWANSNRIKVEFDEEYDDNIKKGRVIEYTSNQGSVVEIGTNIKIIISKGPISMIEFTDIDTFKDWAKENEILYNIEYQYSDTVPKGKLISSSHSKGQIIKNTDTIKLIISDGGKTTVPNLIGLSRNEAEKKCKDANLICIFNADAGTVVKQQMRANSQVPTNTTINITLEQ